MPHQMTQNERLDYLVEAFKADSGEYRYLRTPKDTEGKRRILRSLMNIRMPGEMWRYRMTICRRGSGKTES